MPTHKPPESAQARTHPRLWAALQAVRHPIQALNRPEPARAPRRPWCPSSPARCQGFLAASWAFAPSACDVWVGRRQGRLSSLLQAAGKKRPPRQKAWLLPLELASHPQLQSYPNIVLAHRKDRSDPLRSMWHGMRRVQQLVSLRHFADASLGLHTSALVALDGSLAGAALHAADHQAAAPAPGPGTPPQQPAAAAAVPVERQRLLQVSIVGVPNAGKSTLTNALVGQKVKGCEGSWCSQGTGAGWPREPPAPGTELATPAAAGLCGVAQDQHHRAQPAGGLHRGGVPGGGLRHPGRRGPEVRGPAALC